jgi:RNA-binding protein
MDLSERQKRHLRKLAHSLHPIIHIGDAGLTEPVAAETDRALRDHELIKVRVRGTDRATRDSMLGELARRTGSVLVQRIGHVAVLYRPNPGVPKLVIPDHS